MKFVKIANDTWVNTDIIETFHYTPQKGHRTGSGYVQEKEARMVIYFKDKSHPLAEILGANAEENFTKLNS